MDADGSLVLAALDILEVLHQFPSITRWNDADMGDLLPLGRAVDPPLYQTAFETGNRLNLTFASGFDPALFPEAALRTCLEIENVLETTSRELANAIAEYELTINTTIRSVEEMTARYG